MRTNHGHGHGHEPRQDPLVDMGYETRDLNIRNIAKATIGFFIFTFACFGLVGVWFYFTNNNYGVHRDPRKPLPQYPNPLLQTDMTTRTDIMTLRQNEARIMTTTAPNRDGTVRIPVDRAIAILAQRGVAPTGAEVPAQSPGNTIKQNALPNTPQTPTVQTPYPGQNQPGATIPTAPPHPASEGAPTGR